MDRKELKTLADIFRYLADNSANSGTVTTENIPQQLLSKLPQLTEMGLDIEQTSKYIKVKHKIEYIDAEKLAQELQMLEINKPLQYYFTTSSTNLLAKKIKKPVIILAEHQSLGQGRKAKQWLSPLGQSIAISINHSFDFGLNKLAGLNIAVGVALINAAKKCGKTDLGLKWPNDIMDIMSVKTANQTKAKVKAKVAGILIEATGNAKQTHVSIGLGINWHVRKSLLDSIPQACNNIGITHYAKTEFIKTLIIEIEKIFIEFSHHQIKHILPIWHTHDIFTDKQICVIDQHTTYPAKYLRVDKQGMLTVVVNNKIKTIASGEVSITQIPI
ncbi:MAG: biotin--[acetyl-CoA-carboxylase] ligase [Proteobacteria bacterium]|nr:biotin--[acetyl-CoA-carboxylase] ligase [Pseudomonadota bacterium]